MVGLPEQRARLDLSRFQPAPQCGNWASLCGRSAASCRLAVTRLGRKGYDILGRHSVEMVPAIGEDQPAGRLQLHVRPEARFH